MPMSPRLLRPRASGFNPKSIAGLKVWLDASSASSLTLNGSTVSQINDLSGNGFHATQGTANNQPTYQAAGLNGKPTLFFDASNDIIASTATVADFIGTPTTSPTFTLFLVAYNPTTPNGGGITIGTGGSGSGAALVYYAAFGDFLELLDVANSSGGRVSASGTAANTLTPTVITLLRHGATMTIRRNGVVVATKTNASGVFTATTDTLRIPQSSGFGRSMYMSEAFVYSTALTSQEIARAERGLGRKWGITVA